MEIVSRLSAYSYQKLCGRAASQLGSPKVFAVALAHPLTGFIGLFGLLVPMVAALVLILPDSKVIHTVLLLIFSAVIVIRERRFFFDKTFDEEVITQCKTP